jgi:hypothetical protein
VCPEAGRFFPSMWIFHIHSGRYVTWQRTIKGDQAEYHCTVCIEFSSASSRSNKQAFLFHNTHHLIAARSRARERSGYDLRKHRSRVLPAFKVSSDSRAKPQQPPSQVPP